METLETRVDFTWLSGVVMNYLSAKGRKVSQVDCVPFRNRDGCAVCVDGRPFFEISGLDMLTCASKEQQIDLIDARIAAAEIREAEEQKPAPCYGFVWEDCSPCFKRLGHKGHCEGVNLVQHGGNGPYRLTVEEALARKGVPPPPRDKRGVAYVPVTLTKEQLDASKATGRDFLDACIDARERMVKSGLVAMQNLFKAQEPPKDADKYPIGQALRALPAYSDYWSKNSAVVVAADKDWLFCVSEDGLQHAFFARQCADANYKIHGHVFGPNFVKQLKLKIRESTGWSASTEKLLAGLEPNGGLLPVSNWSEFAKHNVDAPEIRMAVYPGLACAPVFKFQKVAFQGALKPPSPERRAPLKGKACDCGAEKCRTTHAAWCSTNG